MISSRDMCLFVYTRFAMPLRDGQEMELWKDREWVHQRVHIYKQLTLHSLRRQTDSDFTIIFDCCEESRPTVAPYVDELQADGVNVVFDGGAKLISNVPSRYHELAMLRIDSDDMYAMPAVQTAKRCLARHRAMLFVGGFWWHIRKQQVRQWIKPSPPFYAVRRRRCEIQVVDDFIGERLARRGRRQGHSLFRREFRPVLAPGMFCVCMHGYNQRGGHGYGRRRFAPRAILPQFGVAGRVWRAKQLSVPSMVPSMDRK